MVEQSGELHLLIFPCCFPHACQPLGHALPALSRVRVRWTCVLLDRRPSLLTLRQRSSVVVRMIHRYYTVVCLLRDVHAARAAIALSRRPASWCCSRGL